MNDFPVHILMLLAYFSSVSLFLLPKVVYCWMVMERLLALMTLTYHLVFFMVLLGSSVSYLMASHTVSFVMQSVE